MSDGALDDNKDAAGVKEECDTGEPDENVVLRRDD